MKLRAPDFGVLGLVAPFLLWGLAFVALYGTHGAACAVGFDESAGANTLRLVLASLLAGFLVAHVWLALLFWRLWRSDGPPASGFLRLASLVLALSALATTAWTGVPVLVLTPCI